MEKDNLYELPKFEQSLLKMFPNINLIEYMPFEKNACNAYKPEKNLITITTSFPHLTHEIAHMVEMNNFNRLIKNDWGMYGGIPNTKNSPFNKPFFAFAAFARECRVRAIGSYLNKANSFKNNAWFNMANKHLPYGRFKTKEHVNDWIETMFWSTCSKWSLDRIYYEWSKRV